MTDHIEDDPFAVAVDEDDPFATADDVKSSGVFVPRPPVDALAERLVVLVPRSFDKEAKVSDYLRETYNLPETREEWTIDLIVLNGGELKYTYRSKVQDSKDQFEEKEMVVTEFPFTVPNFKVTWANIIGSLNKLSSSPRPFGIGHIRAGYSAKEMRSGKTFEDFKNEMAAWEKAARVDPKKAGTPPKAKWHFVVSEDAADRELARKWWTVAKAEGFRVS